MRDLNILLYCLLVHASSLIAPALPKFFKKYIIENLCYFGWDSASAAAGERDKIIIRAFKSFDFGYEVMSRESEDRERRRKRNKKKEFHVPEQQLTCVYVKPAAAGSQARFSRDLYTALLKNCSIRR